MTVIDALEVAGFEVIEAGTADEAMDKMDNGAIHFLFRCSAVLRVSTSPTR
jgi:two-component system cell cycle response regulator CpdR